MLLNISDIIEDKGLPITCKERLNVPSKYNLTSNIAIVDFSGEIVLRGGIYLLTGVAHATISCCCDICLTDMSIPLKFDITEEFSNDDTDVLDVWKVNGKVIDIAEPLLVNLLLNIPMKYVCKDDCKGLCQICGTNLNNSLCNCKAYKHSQFECLNNMRFDNKEV